MMTSTPSPDDICAVCQVTRAEHGDSNHEFNLEDVLIPKKKPAPAPNTPPAQRGVTVGVAEVVALNLRLVERLIAKGVLEGDDLVYIFGGGNADNRG